MKIVEGRYLDVQNDKIFVVLKMAQHTEAPYRLAIMHEEGHSDEWVAKPETAFQERIIKDKVEVARFKKLEKEEVAK